MLANILIAVSLLILLVVGVTALFLAGKRQKSASMERPENDEE